MGIEAESSGSAAVKAAEASHGMVSGLPSSATSAMKTQGAGGGVMQLSDTARDALAEQEEVDNGTEVQHTVAHAALEAPASSASLETLAANGRKVEASYQPRQSQTKEELASEAAEEVSCPRSEPVNQPDAILASDGNAGQGSESERRTRIVASADLESQSTVNAKANLPSTKAAQNDAWQAQEHSSTVHTMDSWQSADTEFSDKDETTQSPSEGPSRRESVHSDGDIQFPAVDGGGEPSPREDGETISRRRCDEIGGNQMEGKGVAGDADGNGLRQFPALDDNVKDTLEVACDPIRAPTARTTSLDGAIAFGPPGPPTRCDLETVSGCKNPAAAATTVGDNAHVEGAGNFGRHLLVFADARKLVDEAVSSSLAIIAREKCFKPNILALQGTSTSKEAPVLGQDSSQEETPLPCRAGSQRDEPTPSRDSSLCARLRADVARDFLSYVCEIASAMAAATAAKASTPAMAEVPINADLATKMRHQGPIQGESPSKAEGRPADSALQPQGEAVSAFGALPSRTESLAKRATAADSDRRPVGGNGAETSGLGEGQEKATGPPTPVSTSHRLPQSLSASLCSGVVEGCLSDALPGILAAEVAAAAVAAAISSIPKMCAPPDAGAGVKADQPTTTVSPPRDRGANPDTENAPEAGSSLMTSPGPLSTLAARSSVVEVVAVMEHETPLKDANDRGCRSENACDGSRSPTPPSTSTEDKVSSVDPPLEREMMLDAGTTVGGGPSAAPRSSEALTYLTEVGSRAKSRQERSGKTRVDTSSWLRDTGTRAISAQDKEQAERLECTVLADYLSETLPRVVAVEVATTARAALRSMRTCAPEITTSERRGEAAPVVFFTRDTGTIREETLSAIEPELDPEVPFDAIAGNGRSSAPLSAEGLPGFPEVGTRGKCLRESSDKVRIDVSSCLRDTGRGSLALQGAEQAVHLERAVVAEYLSDALLRVVAAEAAATAATEAAASLSSTACTPSSDTVPGRDQDTPGVSYPYGGPRATVDEAGDDISNGDNPASDLAVRSSTVQAKAAVEDGSPNQTDTSSKDGNDHSSGKAENTIGDGLRSPTPPDTPKGKRLSNVDDSELEAEVPFKAGSTADGVRAPALRSAEALTSLGKTGTRAKSTQERYEKIRGDACFWLQDAGGRALSVQDREHTTRLEHAAVAEYLSNALPEIVVGEVAATAAAALCSLKACVSAGATTATTSKERDQATKSVPFAPGLGFSQEERRLDPELDTEMPLNEDLSVHNRKVPTSRSVEACTYLTEVGARAKCLEEISEKHRVDTSSWLRDAGGRALSVQDREHTARLEHAAVAQYLSDALPGIVAAEVAATAAADAAPTIPNPCALVEVSRAHVDQATPGDSPPHDPGAVDGADNFVEADDSPTTREDSASILAMRSSIVDAVSGVERASAKHREASSPDGGGSQGSGVASARESPSSPTPPATPEKERPGNEGLRLYPEVLSEPDPDLVDGGQTPPPRSVETFNPLMDVGLRAQPSQEAAEWLCLAGGRARSAQGRVDRARMDASSWLRDVGSRALCLQGREQAGRLECAAWLRVAGGRAKSAQKRVERAHADAVSWLREMGVRAVSLQDGTGGAPPEAVAWLATNGTLELEQTASLVCCANGGAGAPAVEVEVEVEDDSEKTAQYRSLERSIAKGESQPGSPAVYGSPRADKPCTAAETGDVGAGVADKEPTRQAPHVNNEETVRPTSAAEEHLPAGGENDDFGEVTTDTNTPPPPSQTLTSAGSEATATATATAAVTADADHTADFEQIIGGTASTDRTAPAPWLEPATTPLASTTPGVEDFGRMLEAGEKEWSRVSLSRTPPFDALNSPSLPLRYAPVRGRPRRLPPDDVTNEAEVKMVAMGEGVHRCAVGAAAGAGIAPDADGSRWMGYFAPPNQMAPKGDAYRGSEGFRSAEASASTTVRADSPGSILSASYRASDGTDDGRRQRRRGDDDDDGSRHGNGRTSRRPGDSGGTSREGWVGSLGEVSVPAREAQCRMMERMTAEEEGDTHPHKGVRRWGETGSVSRASRNARGSGDWWHKKAEQSREYLRRWEVFLGRAQRHFDGEADVRKRISVIRRAHPDVSNEVAFVALTQSCGRSSEAAAVLHLPRAKEEAALVAMMLDVAVFIGLAREAAERRRWSRQLEKQRRRMDAAAGHPSQSQSSGRSQQPSQHQYRHQHQHQHHRQEAQYPRRQNRQRESTEGQQLLDNDSRRQRKEEQRSGGERGVKGAIADSIGHTVDRSWHQRHEQNYGAEPISARSGTGGSRGELQSRRSDSAPSLLPPIEGRLTEGTPPSPGSLKAVLSTSTSVAIRVPSGFGLTSEAEGGSEDGGEIARGGGSTSTRRELRAMLRARARWQRRKMAEMAAPGTEKRQRQGFGGGLDAITERFLRETRTLDRDSEDLDVSLRGRQKKKRGRPKARGPHRTGVGGGGEHKVFGNGSNIHSGGDGGDRQHQWLSTPPSSSTFLASVNSNPRAPFLWPEVTTAAAAAADERGVGCATLSPAAAQDMIATAAIGGASSASTCRFSFEARAVKDRGSCRVQSYFTQALGDESLCGANRGLSGRE